MSQRNSDVKYWLLLENLLRHQKVPWIWSKSYDKGQYICQHIWLANIYVNTAQFVQKNWSLISSHCTVELKTEVASNIAWQSVWGKAEHWYATICQHRSLIYSNNTIRQKTAPSVAWKKTVDTLQFETVVSGTKRLPVANYRSRPPKCVSAKQHWTCKNLEMPKTGSLSLSLKFDTMVSRHNITDFLYEHWWQNYQGQKCLKWA